MHTTNLCFLLQPTISQRAQGLPLRGPGRVDAGPTVQSTALSEGPTGHVVYDGPPPARETHMAVLV